MESTLPRSNSSPVSLVDRLTPLPSTLRSSLKKRHSTFVLATSHTSPSSFRLASPILPSMSTHRSLPPQRRAIHSIIYPSNLAARSHSDIPLSSSTGAPEDVTPWDLFRPRPTDSHDSPKHSVDIGLSPAHFSLHPPPSSASSSSSQIVRSPLTGLVEDVTPWELFEPPFTLEKVPESPSKQSSSDPAQRSSRHPRSSTQSSAAARAISDLALRRRKSGGNTKSSKSRSNTLPTNPLVFSHPPPIPIQLPAPPPPQKPRIDTHVSLKPTSKSTPSTPKLGHTPTSSSAPPLLNKLSQSTLSTPATTSASSLHQATMVTPDSSSARKFSTADRTILEELKRNIIAREAHFVFKGPTVSTSGIRVGKKHHSYPRSEVPYPRNFEREVLDLDVWETGFCQEISQSVTWHVFDKPPTKVLDLGCGTGTWILNCARAWRDCHFVGLDIVPVQPDLQRLGSQDLASRITWTQHNFLEGLPFPNDEFDFVHTKRIGLGVPEDKWDFLFEEITRVMKPGGAFEMLEEDLFFPGKLFDDEQDSNSEAESHANDQAAEQFYDADSASLSMATPTAANVPSSTPLAEMGAPIPKPHSRSTSPHSTPFRGDSIAEDDAELTDPFDLAMPPPLPPKTEVHPPQPTLVIPHSRSSVHRTPFRTKVPATSHNSSHLNIAQNKFTNSAVSLISSISGSTGESPLNGDGKSKRRHSGLATVGPLQQITNQQQGPSSPTSSMHGRPASASSKVPLFMLKTLPKPPPNPRDHSILETIYLEMLASRFINPAPLSILANTLQLHFRDVRTHTPVQYSFPPQTGNVRAQKPPFIIPDRDDDSDGARDAHIPTNAHPKRPSRASRTSTNGQDEDHRWLSMQSLIRNESPYISLDDSRNSAFSPALKVAFPLESISPTRAASIHANQGNASLPNAMSAIDIRTLNLHLGVRTTEIVGCAESMWEWILEYQEEIHGKRAKPMGLVIRRTRSGSLEAMAHQHQQSKKAARASVLTNASGTVTESVKIMLADMTREEFDDHLRRFQMDMQDHMALSTELRDRFAWNVVHNPDSTERKTFQDACEKWEHWEAERRRSRSPHARHRASNSVSTSTTAMDASSMVDGLPDIHTSQPKWLRRTYSNLEAHAMLNSSRADANLRTLMELSPSQVDINRASIAPSHSRLSRAMRVFVAWKSEA